LLVISYLYSFFFIENFNKLNSLKIDKNPKKVIKNEVWEIKFVVGRKKVIHLRRILK
jgi:hypothetical protein